MQKALVAETQTSKYLSAIQAPLLLNSRTRFLLGVGMALYQAKKLHFPASFSDKDGHVTGQ